MWVQTRSMCGRFALDQTTEDLIQEFLVTGNNFPEWFPRWNIAPTSTIPIVVGNSTGGRDLHPARWSLVPSWSPELTLSYATFNARSETAATKPTFRDSVRHRRCIVPVSGYFEWATRGSVKTPHYIHHSTRSVFGLAGLYSWWSNPHSGDTIATATIVTRDSVGDVREIHDRMPVMVPPALASAWLDVSHTDGASRMAELSGETESMAGELEFYHVAPLRGEGPELVHRLGDALL
jgi:putative SOS response-associated peptidase YedK